MSTDVPSAVPARATCLRALFHLSEEAKNGSHKHAWCLACLNNRIKVILDDDQKAVSAGTRASVRLYEEAKQFGVFAFTPLQRGS